MFKFKNKNYCSGFTLLEILLVVGIIAILAGIVIVAINPSKQIATVRNTQRLSDIKQINSALQQYYITNGSYPTSLLGDLTEICDTGDGTTNATCTDLIDLSVLVPTYLAAIPKDPLATTTAYTGYQVIKGSTTGLISLNAEHSELGQTIVLGKEAGGRGAVSTLGDGLIAHYKMNDNAGDTTVVDSTENELDGTAIRNTSVMHNADGIVSGALNFDGVDDFISLGVSDLLKPTDATTLSAWVFIPSDFDYQEGIIFSSNEPGVAGGVTMTCFYDYEGSGVWQLRYLPDNIWAGDIPVNQWVHLATTVDGDYVDMYIDGVSVYHGASAGTMPQSSTAIVTIGAYQDNGYVRAFLRGGIDDVRIYDRALTGDEIAELAEGTEAE